MLALTGILLAGCTSNGDGARTVAEVTATDTPRAANRDGDSPAEEQGRITRVDYPTDYDGDVIRKHALVYTPEGYDQDGTDRYDIIYLMHGAGGNADSWLGRTGDDPTRLQNLLDNMIEDGRINPVLVVTPTFYPDDDSSMDLHYAGELDRQFHLELENDLMPPWSPGSAPTRRPLTLKASARHATTERSVASPWAASPPGTRSSTTSTYSGTSCPWRATAGP
ncbi:hypothetical protein [Curtobacterium sp. SL109]|uniref:hypothetical protein n=1 Tax=Curtobacterium sp. SL109 TaxID=2994662 RepID=UPI00227671D9|nr:hypothetical protein [Curtobacterium sp. SL109]MCY1692866.1 hypothetical protein [Curtobacterium sp. SL109]